MEFKTYTLKQNFRAPNVDPGQLTFTNYKMFNAGQSVKGFMPTSSNVDVNFIITDDNYAIPERVLQLPEQKKEIIADGAATEVKQAVANLPKELQEKLNAIKSTDIVKNLVNTSKNSVNGMLYGAVVGALISLFWQKPFFASIVIGSVAGGAISYGATKYINKQPQKFEKNEG